VHTLGRLRSRLSVLMHLTLFTLAYLIAFLLRFDFDVPPTYQFVMLSTLPLALVVKLVAFYVFRIYGSSLRYVTMADLKKLLAASVLASALLVVAERFVISDGRIPRSVFILDWILTLLFVSGGRIVLRVLRERGWPIIVRNGSTRVLIVGAGDAGEGLLREIRQRRDFGYLPVGFLDDDVRKRGMRIGGLPVLGAVEEARGLASAYNVDSAIIAIPSATGANMRRIVHALRDAGLAFKTLPHLARILECKVDATQIGSVTIEELLGREPVKLSRADIRGLIKGKTVAVTGAAGSIGAELCRQIAECEASKLVMLDWSENGLFHAQREMLARFPGLDLLALVANITDRERIARIFELHRPFVVFHAAAHKHVPLMEANVSEAIRNNVFGTKTVVDASVAHGVDRFVLVSTDKAVNPTSIMGMTKRVAEMYVHALGPTVDTDLIAVRFGNVLGSSGSVVPIFKEQISQGGPVTITHPEMTRFFMTIPEAVRLVLRASAVGKGGEILVLDMGEPVKIVDLAKDLIELAGLREPEDIRIEFVGVRPGEKLHEKLHSDEETLVKGDGDGFMLAVGAPIDLDGLLSDLKQLKGATTAGDDEETSRLLAGLTKANASSLAPSEAG